MRPITKGVMVGKRLMAGYLSKTTPFSTEPCMGEMVILGPQPLIQTLSSLFWWAEALG